MNKLATIEAAPRSRESPLDSGEAASLRAEADRLRAGGALGRSTLLTQLFDYLTECSIEGRAPKEIEAASHLDSSPLVADSWERLLEGAGRNRVESVLLPEYFSKQRWFGGKARRLRSTRSLPA